MFDNELNDVPPEFRQPVNRGGRGKKSPVDEAMVRRLAQINCTEIEIAYAVGISQSSLSKRFKHVIAEERNAGKISLRRSQWKKALEGNTTMLVWLGKNELGQSDSPSNEVNLTVNNGNGSAAASPLDELLRRKQKEDPAFIQALFERCGLQGGAD